MFIANDLSYMNKPNENVIFEDFSLENKITKSGMLCWKENARKGTMGKNEQPIILSGSYKLNCQILSKLFNFLITELKFTNNIKHKDFKFDKKVLRIDI